MNTADRWLWQLTLATDDQITVEASSLRKAIAWVEGNAPGIEVVEARIVCTQEILRAPE